MQSAEKGLNGRSLIGTLQVLAETANPSLKFSEAPNPDVHRRNADTDLLHDDPACSQGRVRPAPGIGTRSVMRRQSGMDLASDTSVMAAPGA